MRILVVAITLLFTISLADANQQALLQVQWQQLALQNSMLSSNEKISRIQSLSTLINTEASSTQIIKTPNEIFYSGSASEAELAFTKWMMLKELGFDDSQFRIVYAKDKLKQNTQVWLAWYQDQRVRLITTSDIVDSPSRVERMQQDFDVISIVDPTNLLTSRNNTRVAEFTDQLAIL